MARAPSPQPVNPAPTANPTAGLPTFDANEPDTAPGADASPAEPVAVDTHWSGISRVDY